MYSHGGKCEFGLEKLCFESFNVLLLQETAAAERISAIERQLEEQAALNQAEVHR